MDSLGWLTYKLADLGGGSSVHVLLPMAQKLLQFHAVILENLAKLYVGAFLERWRSLLRETLDPPLVYYKSCYFTLSVPSYPLEIPST